jgi:hypothetical protein
MVYSTAMEIPCRMLLMRQRSVTCCARPFAALDKDLFSGPFFQVFSSWLLPNLALISQLPFGNCRVASACRSLFIHHSLQF